MNIGKRFTEPSSAAGAALVGQSFMQLLADPKNPTAWLGFIGGIFAIFMPEKGNAAAP